MARKNPRGSCGFLAMRGATVRATEIDQLNIPEIRKLRTSDARLDFGLVKRGEAIFRGKGQCTTCHPLRPDAGSHLIGPSLLKRGL